MVAILDSDLLKPQAVATPFVVALGGAPQSQKPELSLLQLTQRSLQQAHNFRSNALSESPLEWHVHN